MTAFKSTLAFFAFAFAITKVAAQANPYISVLPSNSGIVTVGGTNDLLITVGNTLSGTIPVSKLRPIVTVPASVNFLPDAEQTGLPAGWTILSNTGTQLRLCNSGDAIPGITSRDIILKVQGITITGPQTFSGQINFGNGSTCAAGPAVSGNNTADDFATSTIEVIAGPVPVKLLQFSASLANCKPVLHWQTENEFNSDHFNVERFNETAGSWETAGSVAAAGNSGASEKYSYADAVAAGAEKILYRLKIVDADGTYRYSNTIPVLVNCSSITSNIFPNPVKDGNLYVSLTGTKNGAEGKLVSVTGQTILKTKLNNGTNHINVSNVANGTYMIQITEAGGINKQWKVIVQH